MQTILEDSYKDIFNKINKTAAFKASFSMLWYSSLPCYDVNGITSAYDGEKSLLKSCAWKGLNISCAAIFKTFPTDQGMCCSFNMKAADEIFQQATYSKLVMDHQTSDAESAFIDSTIPSWYSSEKEPKIQPGINKGLTLLIDAHNDILAQSSVETDYSGFTGIITSTGSYPLTNREGFQIKAGHFNLVGLSATKISASPDIKALNPKARNCRFPDESSGMKIHKVYSQANCLLECSLFYAEEKLGSKCFPWYFPTYKKSSSICSPWETANFTKYFNNVPAGQCADCTPDCEFVIYEPTITAVPFRKCDFRNLGINFISILQAAF